MEESAPCDLSQGLRRRAVLLADGKKIIYRSDRKQNDMLQITSIT